MKYYVIDFSGRGESPIRGAVPEDVGKLTEKNKDAEDLKLKILKETVDNLLQAGDTGAAIALVTQWEEEQAKSKRGFSYPLNVFKKDLQNGGSPYVGAHCVFGAFRNAAKDLHPKHFWVSNNRNKPAAKRLRRQVQVKPYHLFLTRNNKIIEQPDHIVGMAPNKDGGVGGFAQYEQIELPWEFKAKILIYPDGPFKALLKDKGGAIELLGRAALNSLGACRGAGFGQWGVLDAKIQAALST